MHHQQVLVYRHALLLQEMGKLVQHFFGLLLDEQRMKGDLSLVDDGLHNLIAQLVANAPLLTFEYSIADGLAQVFQVFVLLITHLAGQGIIKLRNFFNLYLMNGNREMALFTCQFLVGVVFGQDRGKLFALSCLHTYNILIHAGEHTMAFPRQFKRIIFQVRNVIVFDGELEIGGNTVIVVSRAFNFIPGGPLIAQRL